MQQKHCKQTMYMFLLHRAKCICLNCELYLKEAQKSRLMFNSNRYFCFF